MKKKLYISDDAPDELKEVISVTQRMMDNLAEFKVKADNGTLTFADLDELARRNNAISDEFPKAKQPIPGYPVQTNNMAELEALSKTQALEAERLLKEQGGPVFKITSFERLEELSKLSPAALGDMVLEEAKRKRKEEAGQDEVVDSAESKELTIKEEFHNDLLKENLDVIQDLLYEAKLILFNLQHDWPEVEPFERQLHLNAKAFKGNEQSGTALLAGILKDEVEDEDLADKKLEAAFILASIASESGGELDLLFEFWDEFGELAQVFIQALKYSKNPFVIAQIQQRFDTYSPAIQAGLVEVLEFKEQLTTENWKLSAGNHEPPVLEKIYRAHLNSGIRKRSGNLVDLRQDPEAEWYEDAMFSSLIAGDEEALMNCRRRLIDAPDKVVNLPIYLACACGNNDDLLIVERCIPEETIRTQVITALGILGLPRGVSALIELIDDEITSKEHWDVQYRILESLNLITGADLPLLLPEIKEGPEDKKHEIKVEINWKSQWFSWWMENQHRFDSGLRYRRGVPFTIESCMDEMSFQRGNYWSRQYSFHELQIRTRESVAPFFADWDVKDQMRSIETWRKWWEENKRKYRTSQWMFAGKP